MCIRDRTLDYGLARNCQVRPIRAHELDHALQGRIVAQVQACLLYTSDAADERSSVDLGGRRIIKKKKRHNTESGNTDTSTIQLHETNQSSK